MMSKTNIKWVSMSDEAILKRIGLFVKNKRISKQKTQSQIAVITGLNRYTIGKIEKGGSVTLHVLIRVLRSLDLLQVLDNFVYEEEPSPLEFVKLKKKKKQRVRSTTKAPLKDHRKSDW